MHFPVFEILYLVKEYKPSFGLFNAGCFCGQQKKLLQGNVQIDGIVDADYSSGIDPLIQQADPLVIGIGSAKQRTMV